LGHTWTQGVPIEIVPIAHVKVLKDIHALGAQHAQLRMGGHAKAGPIITDNGNFIIDAHFGEIGDPAQLARSIKDIFGVVDVGLFVQMANAAYFGNEGGSPILFEADLRWKCYYSGKKQARKKNCSYLIEIYR
jgi:ribose 5-phosphate isomerase A